MITEITQPCFAALTEPSVETYKKNYNLRHASLHLSSCAKQTNSRTEGVITMKQITRNKMDTNAVVYKSTFLTVRFDEQGLELTPWRARPLRIDWHEVDFVYPLPMLERGSDGWREQANPFSPKGFRSMLKSTGRLKLYVIVNDRRPIIARTTDRLTHNYISRQLRPMADADGRLLEDQSDLCLDLRLKRLGGSITPLMDLVTKHSRIGLLLLDWIE